MFTYVSFRERSTASAETKGIWGGGEGLSIFLRWLLCAGTNFTRSCYNNESLINVQRTDRTKSDVREMHAWTAARIESRQIVHRTQGHVFL